MRDPETEFSQIESRLQNAYLRQVASQHWLDCPMVFSIETFSKCNAACEFCPYPSLERIGTKLPKQRVIALLDEAAAFPVPPARLNLCRVNEPFLDPDLFAYLDHAARVLPATGQVLFSNGQPLTDRVIDRLIAQPSFKSLTISFNEHERASYERVMQISYDLTLKRLDNLHARAARGDLNFSVALSRVGLSTPEDQDFMDWCAKRFPLFPASSAARFAWVGDAPATSGRAAPDAGCLQWFTLHVLANGRAAFCCIDGNAAGPAMHIDSYSLHEMYNIPAKRAHRETATSRRNVEGCETCIHGMTSASYAAAPDSTVFRAGTAQTG